MQITPPFGRLITAMVTPFTKSGEIDWAGVEKIANHLVSTGHDGIAVNGTTGEAPTTSDDEKDQIIKAVRKVVGDKIKIVAGAGNNETSHSVEQAQRAAKAGADGLLVVTPYYNKPPQAGIQAHFTAMADATDLPVMMYDIPGRTGVEIESDTIVKLAEHKNIVALKDAKGNPAATSWVIKRSEIPVYSVISPEGCASILWRDPKKAKEAAEAMKISSQDLLENKIIDEIIKEPKGGAHRNHDEIVSNVTLSIKKNLNELIKISPEELIYQRKNRFLSIGRDVMITKEEFYKDTHINTVTFNPFNWKLLLQNNRKLVATVVVIIILFILVLIFA